MLIVDAQVHLWNAGNPSSPWHRQVPAYFSSDDRHGRPDPVWPALWLPVVKRSTATDRS